jgi:hypothetical protein
VKEFRTRGAPLEYWFLKVRSGELSFLVDWIIRRGQQEAEVRVSLFVRGQGRVLRSTSSTWWDHGSTVDVAGCRISPRAATGEVDDVRWDLACDAGTAQLDPVPRPAKLLRPFDLQLAARPRAHFIGTVEVAGETFALANARGTLSHYWGRRLPDSWVWVSADTLGEGGAEGHGVVEAALIRTRLWGAARTSLVGGYLMVEGGGRRTQIMAPTYGRLAATGTGTSFEIRARSRGRDVRLTATAPTSAYNDLGEGIQQTLLGDVTVHGWGSSHGSSGLEYRGNLLASR